MSYVIYNKETTVQFSTPARSVGCWTDSWKSKGAATRAFNKAVKEGKINADEYAIADIIEFRESIEKSVTKTIPGTGKKVTMRVNTPACCDPTTETYMCM